VLYNALQTLTLDQCFQEDTYKQLDPYIAELLFDQMNNHQVRQVSGLHISGKKADMGPKPVNGVNLALAEHNIDESFAWIGFSGGLNAAWPALSERFGWKVPETMLVENKSEARPSRTTLDSDVFARIKQWNTFDFGLIHWVRDNMDRINARKP